MRVFTISDIHIDYPENRQWLSALSRYDFIDDALILAGDVSDKDALIKECFDTLKARFQHVFFLPGNHDIWLPVASNQHVPQGQLNEDSLQKFDRLLAIAASFDVLCSRKVVGGIDIVPLQSWYDFSFGQPDERLLRQWVDFQRCRWPDELANSQQLSEFFHQRNQDLKPSKYPSISFSHFLPRLDVMPAYIPERFRYIYPVLGSWQLDKQVRELGAAIHIYGHSHVNQDIQINGVRYINNAFAYPTEHWAEKRLKCVFPS